MLVTIRFFFSSRRRHTRLQGDWSSDVCSSDLFSASFGVVFDDGVYGGVGHAVRASDYAFVDFVGGDFSLVIDFHGAGEDEAVDLRAQAADVGREFERQHGDGAVGEIDAGAAQTGFLIERRVGRYILGYVGDVDLEFVVSVFELADVDRVVEIARGFSVDGDDREIAVVAAAVERLGRNLGCNSLRFFDYFGREAVRQMILADHDFYIDAEIRFFAEDFYDAAARILRGAWPVGDFYVYYYAFQILPVGVDFGFVAYDSVDGTSFLRLYWLARRRLNHGGHRGHGGRAYGEFRNLHSGRDHYVLRYFFVDGFDVVLTGAVVEDAYDGRMGTREGA